MGIKRIVDTSFWTDGKVDDFSPEDKYFMLYLMTNPFTTQLGIYEISVKQVAFQLGYSVDSVNVLLDRFENKYNMIAYSKHTNEVAIKNYLRHSIIKGGAPVRDCLVKELKKVKNKSLITWVFSNIKDYENLNETVKKIISEYEEKNGAINYHNEKHNDNDNENDNEVSYHDSSNVSSNSASNDTPKVSKKDISEFFESIWKLYPNKKGKGQVSDSKKKKLYEIGIDEMTRAIERYNSDLKKEDWRKPQNGSTFFNSGYVDYLDANYSPVEEKKEERKTTYRNKFNNAPQRNYEMDALERMLLEQQNFKQETDASFLAEAEALQKELQQKYGR